MVKDPLLAAALTGFGLIGAYSLTRSSMTLLSSLNRHWMREPHDIYKRYAKHDSWVVVTGGSDGIGLEICH